jgi:hypothetical protein
MPRPKYGNVRTKTADGVNHASRLEAKRWGELKLLEKAGQISALARQVRFELRVNDIAIGLYVPDFVYKDLVACVTVAEDCKGHPTPLYKWKRKHFEIQYPRIEFREIRK